MGEGTDEDHTGEEKSNQCGGQQNLDRLKDVQLTTLRTAMARHAKDKLEPHQFYALPARSSVDVRVPMELLVVDVRALSDDACEAACCDVRVLPNNILWAHISRHQKNMVHMPVVEEKGGIRSLGDNRMVPPQMFAALNRDDKTTSESLAKWQIILLLTRSFSIDINL